MYAVKAYGIAPVNIDEAKAYCKRHIDDLKNYVTDTSYLINKLNNIFLSSLVPVIGFTISTVSLKFIRKIWEKR